MHCLDCALISDTKNPAVAYCRSCGGAVCLEHAAVLQSAPVPVGLLPAEPKRRVISCLNCSTGTDRPARPAQDARRPRWTLVSVPE
ncbi:hypothetical protein [Kineosporia sp. NBRC 101731]|uniref:hypothetical protein n=1 Tax=Kineosporia sp. NBRC 101731 TaxID=3032199 RepID=UPI0024A0A474|nr:hypothetical protein [Kineosporia sp. NBRC 101731]GLY32635.1 hypothetical protein Kisp02_60000 [Kineosporia sp. NBRC 101731]